MFKNIIAPVQAWLLSQRRCVGCGMPLSKGKVSQKFPRSGISLRETETEELVNCKCGRVFIRETKTGKYRRALLFEV